MLWALGYGPVRYHLLSLLTYTFNIELALSGKWVAGISHLWSLAVEEQFYLIWPWLVLFLPRRGLIAVGAGLIVAAPVLRILHHTFWTNQFNTLLLFENTDGLCLGALLAVLGVHSEVGKTASRAALRWGGGVIIATVLALGLFAGKVYVVERIA